MRRPLFCDAIFHDRRIISQDTCRIFKMVNHDWARRVQPIIKCRMTDFEILRSLFLSDFKVMVSLRICNLLRSFSYVMGKGVFYFLRRYSREECDNKLMIYVWFTLTVHMLNMPSRLDVKWESVHFCEFYINGDYYG